MILEVIIQSIFSGVGSTLLKEWMRQAKKKDDAELQRLIEKEIKEYVHRSASGSIVINEAVITEIVRRLKAGEVTLQFGREIVEEQLKRARRRKKEIQDFIAEAEHMQGNLLQNSKRLLNAMSHLNGARDDEFTVTEKNENASVGNPALQSQLEQLRWQEKLHHERTRDNMTRPHTDPIKSATSMSDDQLLDHWKTILAAYRERLGVIETRIRRLETIRARLAAGEI